MSHKNKRFFCGEFTTDDVQLSDEHYEHGFYTLKEVLNMDDITSTFKEAIKKCLGQGLGGATSTSEIGTIRPVGTLTVKIGL